MKTADDLGRELHRLDGKPYPAYKDLSGNVRFEDFVLFIDHVQGDPFAAPSRLRLRIPLERAGFPKRCWEDRSRRKGFCSLLAHAFSNACRVKSKARGSGRSGQIFNDAPGQEVLSTSAVQITDGEIDARFFVGLPAAGRRILGGEAAGILCVDLPQIARESLFAAGLDEKEADRWADTAQDADILRQKLADLGLAAFVADGAVLPRKSGVDQHPLRRGAVPFRSPEGLRVEVNLPNSGRVTGMGIPRGVTLIVGGGFHGKSTLLQALERGVYNHRPGDGRELVVSDPTAVKIRAEDGRAITGVDISPFIGHLPQGVDTRFFSTGNASGSTSQAANILEALEAGSTLLLVDEDTSATNFMIRDHRMQKLISKEKEPITPFIDRVRQLWQCHGVSTILVMGGSGDYFETADTVIAMEDYLPREVTEEARRIAERYRLERKSEGNSGFNPPTARIPLGSSLDPRKGRREESVKARGIKTVHFGTEEIELDAVEQVVHPGQLRAVGAALLSIKTLADGRLTLSELLDTLGREIDSRGLDFLTDRPMPDLAEFRRFELAAALNRLRTLAVQFPRKGI
ncbi:MAG: ABC-ATPase domain-containing protein [bacterium]|nr:MAG: ABC-ATPase domain-containing protein [bacterium]